MRRLLTAAALVASFALPGCVIVPTGTTGPRMASLDKVMVAVALPTGTDLASYRGGTPWNRARLTVTRLDGAAPDLVQALEGVKGGLKAKAPLNNLDPSAPYRMDLELIYDEPSGLERVVARGALGTDDEDAVALKPGSNALKIPVAATVTGDRIALEPLVTKKATSTRGGSSRATSIFSDDDTTVVGEDAGDKAIAAVVGAIVSGLLGGGDDEDDDEPVTSKVAASGGAKAKAAK